MNLSKFTLALPLVLFAFGTDSAAQTSRESAISTRLTFSVLDKHKAPFTTLLKEDLRIAEDDQPQQILTLERQAEMPIALSFLIDMSASQESVLAATRTAALTIAKSVLRPGKDTGSVATFAGYLWVKQAATGDLKEVQSALGKLKLVLPTTGQLTKAQMNTGFLTAIWDATCLASEQMFAQANMNSRRVMILMTDGHDTLSKRTVSDAIDCAIKSKVTVYVIDIEESGSFGSSESASIERRLLRELAAGTGGRALFRKEDNGLGSTIVQIQRDLEFQYAVTYLTTSKKQVDSPRKVEIEVINPELKKEKLKLTYPHKLFAGSP